MSDNIYDILNNFNKVAQEPQKPATQSQPKAKTQLQESMDHVLAEKYMGFKKAAGADKKSSEVDSLRIGSNLPQSDTETFGIEPGRGYKVNTPKDWKPGDRPRAIQQLIPTQDKKDHIRSRLGKHKAPVLPEDDGDDSLQSIADKDIERDHPEGDGTGGYVKDTDMDESALQAYLGNKKYGKKGMDALRKAGRDGASKETMAKIRAKHDKMDEDSDAKITKTPTGFAVSAPAGKRLSATLDKDGKIKPTDVKVIPKSDDEKKDNNSTVKEVAPPGAKAERMVKHIKKGYAKDGKLTKTEKSKAYGAAWKAHNKGKVEEAIKAMYEAGFTKEQIIEGWDDMLKAVEKRSKDKGTGKFDKKQISTGTVYTRKYDPKTGETDDSENVTAVKRGRGRPKKSTFESSTTANKMIAEHFRELIEGSIQGGVWTSNPPKKGQPDVPVPQNPDGGSVNPAPKPKATQSPQKPQPTPPMGSIKGGVWTAEPPKPGEKGVPVPVPVDEADMEEGNEFSGALDAARDAGEKTFKVNGKTYPVKEGQELLQMLRIAGIKVMEDAKVDEDDMEEGNEFSGELAKAKAAGAKEFKVDGKTYPVKENAQLDECGMSPMGNGMMGQDEQEGKMNVNTSMDSDGHKSVTITADGNAALELMQMLKLAGMGGGEMSQKQPEGVMVVSTGDDEEELSERMPLPNLGPDGQPDPADMQKLQQARASREQMSQELTKQQAWNTAKPETLKPSTSTPAAPASMEVPIPRLPQKPVDVPEEKEVDEAKDERYHANTTPEEHVMPVQVQTKGGDGDVAGQEKKMTPHGYQFGDNPQAMKESMSLKLIKEYEAIKVKK